MKSVHEGIKSFKCNLCDYQATQISNLKIHIDSVHEGTKPFKCNLCYYKAAQNASLKRHIRSVHEKIKTFKWNYKWRHHQQPFWLISLEFKSAKKLMR